MLTVYKTTNVTATGTTLLILLTESDSGIPSEGIDILFGTDLQSQLDSVFATYLSDATSEE